MKRFFSSVVVLFFSLMSCVSQPRSGGQEVAGLSKTILDADSMQFASKNLPTVYELLSEIQDKKKSRAIIVFNILIKVPNHFSDPSLSFLFNLYRAVHESFHMYSMNDLDSSKSFKFALGQEFNYTINTFKSPPAQIIKDFVPSQVKEFKINPFEDYILSKDPRVVTQSNGILGLFEEYNAYIFNIKLLSELYSYFKNSDKQTYGAWHFLLEQYGNNHLMVKFFQYYIFLYLDYCRKNDPDLFGKMLKEKNFAKTFMAMNQSVLNIEESWDINMKDFNNKLIRNGMKIWQNEGKLFFGTELSNKSVNLYRKIYDFLNTQWDSPEYEELQKLISPASHTTHYQGHNPVDCVHLKRIRNL